MWENDESKVITELMKLAKTVDMLDFSVMRRFQDLMDFAIEEGFADDSFRASILSVLLERAIVELEPEEWKENSRKICKVLDELQVSEAIFHPRSEVCPGSREIRVAEDVQIRYFHDQTSPEMPTLIHYHASDECIADYVQNGFVETIQEAIGKINVLLIEYRGFGGSEGKPRLIRMLKDGKNALNWLGLDPGLCVAYGREVGSLYAIELGERLKGLKGIIIESGIGLVDQHLAMFPELDELLEKQAVRYEGDLKYYFNQAKKLEEYAGHALILHAMKDSIIPASNASTIFSTLTTPNKKLRLFEEGNHHSIFTTNREEILAAMRQLFADAFPDLLGD